MLTDVVGLLEQARRQAEYGERLVVRLSADLTARFGRGFGRRNLFQMRAFYLTSQKVQPVSAQFEGAFPVPWSHCIKLLAVKTDAAREFYEADGLEVLDAVSSLCYNGFVTMPSVPPLLKRTLA